MAQCVSNRCKDLFKRKKDFGVMGTSNILPDYVNTKTSCQVTVCCEDRHVSAIFRPNEITKKIKLCYPLAR